MDKFELYPSLDIVNGKALVSRSAISFAKNESSEIVKLGSPFSIAREYYNNGANWIHIVDLDAASGRGNNSQVILELLSYLKGMLKTQVCGGIRSRELLDKYLNSGCDRVNISSIIINSSDLCKNIISEYGEYVAVAIDAKKVLGSYHLCTHGWNRINKKLDKIVLQLEEYGCTRYVVTDIDRGGSMLQPNIELINYVKKITTKPIISGGGIARLKDINNLIDSGTTGAILGQVIHTNKVPFHKFVRHLERIYDS